MVNGSDTVSGTETVSESEMVYDADYIVIAGEGEGDVRERDKRSLKDKTRERRTYY